MGKIRAYVEMDEVNKIRFFKDFRIVPETLTVNGLLEGEIIKEVIPVRLDCEQGSDEVYNYEYFKVFTNQNGEYDPDNNVYGELWVAVRKHINLQDAEKEVTDGSSHDEFVLYLSQIDKDPTEWDLCDVKEYFEGLGYEVR